MNRLRKKPLDGGQTPVSLMHTSLGIPGDAVDDALLSGNVMELERLLSIGHRITATVVATLRRATLMGDHVDMMTYLLTLPEIKDPMISHLIKYQDRAAVIRVNFTREYVYDNYAPLSAAVLNAFVDGYLDA